MPGVAETCNMEQIKAHSFASHAEWNKYSVIPRGLGFVELLDMPHDCGDLHHSNSSMMFAPVSAQHQHQQIGAKQDELQAQELANSGGGSSGDEDDSWNPA